MQCTESFRSHIFSLTQPRKVVKKAVIENTAIPRRHVGCYEWSKKNVICLRVSKRDIYPDWGALVYMYPKSNDYMCIQENLFVSLHSNGPAHGSFQPCDHNLQFHSWLWEMAQVVWIAWVRHIPSSVSLFIVLIFCERFISFRKSSRKASNAYFLLAGVSGGCGTAGVGGYGNPANWADRRKKKLPLHKLHGFSGDKNHSMFLLTTAVHLYMHL